jgi:hypothetical protein
MRRQRKARIVALIALGALAGVLSACQTENVHEPWMNSSAEQTKKSWLSQPSSHREDEMRTRIMTTQTDR